MSNITQAISYYRINQRSSDPCTTFAVKFKVSHDPPEFKTGPFIEFQLTDSEDIDYHEVYTGRIQKVGRNIIVEDKTYDITGRDNGYYLSRQNYRVSCSLTGSTITKFSKHLEQILENTNIRIGGGQEFKDIDLSNNANDPNFFGGEFKPKYKALDELFKVYCKILGLNKIRWFIDSGSNLRWFEVKKNASQVIKITSGDDLTIFEDTEDAENIVNYLEGYGGADSEIEIALADNDSIKRYGRLEGDPIVDSSITNINDLRVKVLNELKQKSLPVYNLTATFSGIKDFECGQQIMFIDEPKYANTIFIITEITKEGSPADPVTKISVTTDETAISPTNLYENVKAIVDQATKITAIGNVQQVDKTTNQALARPNNAPKSCLVVCPYI